MSCSSCPRAPTSGRPRRGHECHRARLRAPGQPASQGLRQVREQPARRNAPHLRQRALRTASGDVFGRIYEYFLMKFAMQGAQDNGEFFTPPSLVQTIVNVIEPEHGSRLRSRLRLGRHVRPVQPLHRTARRRHHSSRHFYGQEKTATTIRLAKMNLAVHGLEGDIRQANTFYEDVHTCTASATSSWPIRRSTWTWSMPRR